MLRSLAIFISAIAVLLSSCATTDGNVLASGSRRAEIVEALSSENTEDSGIDLALELPFADTVRNTPQLCSGRGEIMSPVELPLAGHCLVLLKPEEGVSTAEAYAGVRPAEPQVPLRDALSLPVAEWDGRVVNDFEPHIFAAHPAIASLKELLVESGAEYASMSGSGSAVYGIFSDKPELPPATVDGLFMHIQRL